MKVLSIQFNHVRNLKNQEISFFSPIQVFYGKNGQGKTSILEAIYFAGTGLSFRTRHTSEMITYTKNTLSCFLEYQDQFSEKSLTVSIEKDKKVFFFLGKKISQMEFFGNLNMIFYIPEDVMLINGSPNLRRLFIDREISQTNSFYLHQLRKFSNLLKIRNKYLKEKLYENEEYTIYEEEFVKCGSYLIEQRKKYIHEISKFVKKIYQNLFDSEKSLEISYKSFLHFENTNSLLEIQEEFRKEIEKKREKEIQYSFSMVGPHKDDFVFLLEGEDAKLYASQGEKKSIIFSLKLSEIDILSKNKQELPIVLIDDVTSYFDRQRCESVLQYLKEKKVQVFLTSTEILNIDAKYYKMEKGEVYEITDS
ncbi:MAG TPA: DNA replication and repair protein RecF [Fusobacterium sp.]|uniref:DNA replication/repair protein RecF n=1 Tax=Fusobacterium sp. TaxID=68766 RepID=UPI002F3E6219